MLPRDVAVTPDGAYAVVRSIDTSPPYDDSFTVWDLANGLRQNIATTPGGPDAQQGGTNLQVSDTIQATNSRAIAIASGPSTTYIDVISIGVPTVIASHAITGTGSQAAGEANDVAVTASGARAIVNSANWIHIVNLNTGALAGQLNIGALAAGPCTPDGAVDSVVCTNRRAVVTTKRDTGGVPSCWVYIVDLGTNSILLEHQVVYAPGSIGNAPHDVELTPDGRMAVVTANQVASLYDVAGGQFVGLFGSQVTRTYGVNVDSIAMSNNRACVTGNVEGPGYSRWLIDMTAIDITNPFTLNFVFDDPLLHPTPTLGFNRPHDLAMTPYGSNGYERCVVRTEGEIVVVNTQTFIGVQRFAVEGNPIHSSIPAGMFVSDSVSISSGVGTSNRFAITLGTIPGPNGAPLQGRVHFLQVDSPAMPPPVSMTIVTTENNCVPADLSLAWDDARVVVRCDDASVAWGAPSGSDIVIFGLPALPGLSPTLQAQISATGTLAGVDSVEVGDDRLISISENAATSSGFVQIIDL